MLKAAKEVLLWCATPDGVFRAENKLPSDEFTFVVNTYCQQQKHDNLLYYLDQKIRTEDSEGLYAQVINIFKADIQNCYRLSKFHIPFLKAWEF